MADGSGGMILCLLIKEVNMDMQKEAFASLNNAVMIGKAMDKLLGQCFPSLYGEKRPCGAMPGDCSGVCDGCGNNPENS